MNSNQIANGETGQSMPVAEGNAIMWMETGAADVSMAALDNQN